MQITPVLLSGGSGTRLWPLSRKSYPKQFVPLLGEETLFQASARRLSGSTGRYAFGPPITVTNADFRFIVTEQLAAAGIDPGPVLIEPEGRNTAPAVLAAVVQALQADPDAVLLIAPSDHVIPDAEAFRQAVATGLAAVERGKIVTFGIRPDRPETGYGYLQLAGTSRGDETIPLARFVEKPDREAAERMSSDGSYLWNAGIFLASASALLEAFSTHAPDLIQPVTEAVAQARSDLGFLRLAPQPWARAETVSIDYAVMEKATNLAVVPFDGQWSDLGSWQAVWQELDRDANEVATAGRATSIDCRNTLLRSEADTLEIVGIGLENVFAVAMPDAVLIADMSRAQEVGRAVDRLRARDALQAETFPRDHRPWGWFESLVLGERFQVKRIFVHPGAALSLQSHVHRAEHWIVVEGTARVTIGEDVRLVTENQSVYIPLGAKHRMENPGKVPMVLIEVQTGRYLGEDDIIRYEDVYAR